MVSQYRLMRVVKLCIWPLFVAILPAGTWMRAVPGDRIQSRNDQRCLERDEVADVGNVKLKAAKFCKWTCRLSCNRTRRNSEQCCWQIAPDEGSL